MQSKGFLHTISLAIIALFSLQLISDFIEGIYAFGLLGTSIPVEISAVVLLFSPLLLVVFRGRLPRPLLPVLLAVALASRLLGPLLDTRWRMIVTGVGAASVLLLFPAGLWARGQEQGRSRRGDLGTAMLLALALSLLLRTLGSGFDLSLLGGSQWIGWILGVVAAVPWVLDRSSGSGEAAPARPAGSPPGGGTARVIGLSLGLAAVFILFYFVFSAPHVLSRWTGVSYGLVLPLAAAAMVAYAWLMRPAAGLRARLTPAWLMAWNGLFVVALAGTALVHQVAFPASAASYPLTQPPVTWLQHLPLILTLLLYPVLLLDFGLLVDGMEAVRPTARQLGAGFGLAALFLLVAILAHVFTTVYDYIPVVGPLFRDRFWLVHVFVGLVALAAMLLVRRGVSLPREGGQAAGVTDAVASAVTVLALVAVTAGVLVSAHPRPPAAGATTLTVLTYNIQQGYSSDGQRNVDGQLALIEQVAPDIVGLQETDNARVAGGNCDVVRYLADRLDMYSYYGPPTVAGTFGIALLSKYPIENPRTFYLFSEGEQVAVIEAQITVGDQTFNVFVTHLGNGGPMVQAEQFLTLVTGKPDVIAMGDFNFRPDSEQYRLVTNLLADSWLVRWRRWTDTAGTSPDHKIDHIFVSPGTSVIDARFIESPASDHPAVTATLGW